MLASLWVMHWRGRLRFRYIIKSGMTMCVLLIRINVRKNEVLQALIDEQISELTETSWKMNEYVCSRLCKSENLSKGKCIRFLLLVSKWIIKWLPLSGNMKTELRWQLGWAPIYLSFWIDKLYFLKHYLIHHILVSPSWKLSRVR